jgi:hypothetical protein
LQEKILCITKFIIVLLLQVEQIMARRYWIGIRQPSAQVETITFTSVGGTGETVTVSAGPRSLTYTRVAGETTTTLAAAVAALWSGSVFPEIREVTAVANGAVITLTGQLSGQPFTFVITNSGSGTPITFTTLSVAAKSPNHVDDAVNYDGGTLPSGTDEIVLASGTPDLLFGLSQFAATAVTIVRQSGGPRIGLPNTNESGGYAEYRRRRMQIQGTAAKLETTSSDGPAAVRLELTGTTAAAITILGDADPGIGGERVELWDVPNNSTVSVNGSGVRILDEDSVAATGIVFNSQNSSAIAASRATLASASLYNSNAIIRGEVTGQYLQDSGSRVDFTGSVNTSTGSIVVDDGQLNWIGNANLVKVDIGSGGIVSLVSGGGQVAVTSPIKRHEGGRIVDPNSRLAVPYDIDLVRSQLSDDLSIGTNRRITVNAIS